MQLLARWREISEEPWTPVSSGGFAMASAAFILVLYLADPGDRWVWILDNANLAFHEAGHPIAGLVSERLAVYGGTSGQLVFPFATTAAFWARRHALSCAICGLWLIQNMFSISVYMGDARALTLPLVGGLDPESFHD